MFNTFTIIGLPAEPSLKLINETRNKIIGNLIFEWKVVTYADLISKHYLYLTTIKGVF